MRVNLIVRASRWLPGLGLWLGMGILSLEAAEAVQTNQPVLTITHPSQFPNLGGEVAPAGYPVRLPRRLIPGQILPPNEASQWSSVEGMVSFVSQTDDSLQMELTAASGKMWAEVRGPFSALTNRLSQSRIRATGSAEARRTTDGLLVAGRLLVPSLDLVEILEAAPQQWKRHPLVAIKRYPARVRGVEVVGFPWFAGPSPILRAAMARQTHSPPLPEPVILQTSNLLSASHDALRVQLDGCLDSLRMDKHDLVLELPRESMTGKSQTKAPV